MEYRDGELLYVCKKSSHWSNGLFVIYRGNHRGSEDLSYHGSPWYEKFIVCEYLNSRDRVEFGNQTYCWRSAAGYIKELQTDLKKIKDIVQYKV